MRWLVGARKAWMALGAVLVLALSHAQPAMAQPAPARPAGVADHQHGVRIVCWYLEFALAGSELELRAHRQSGRHAA